ncbi:hypothetical protein F1880_001923 [Penicillium rolfsii]|nr:hypothetical protein F1880_001923 [Penicillium rolfsii]
MVHLAKHRLVQDEGERIIGDEREGVISETRSQRGVKRELLEDSLTDQVVLKSRKISDFAVEVYGKKSTRNRSTLSNETETSSSVSNSRHHQTGALDFSNEEHDGRYKGGKSLEPGTLMKSNILLRREINLLNVHRDERTAELEGEIARLQEANKDLNAMISRFRDMERVRADQFGTPLEEVRSLAVQLREKDQELDRKNEQITALEEQLSAEDRLQDILDETNSDFTCSSNFSKGLAELEEGTHQLAGFLVQCLSNRRIQNLRKKPRRHPELSKFITDTLGRIGQLVSSPTASIRALIFSYVRERIFLSNCWTALHFEGYMLRELQDVIQKMYPRSTLQSLHKAAIESMLGRNSEFVQCWIRTEVEDHQCQFLELLSPLLDHRELADMRYQLERDLKILFTDAFKDRSRLFAPNGVQFELVQFKPGVTFDPNYMRVQGESATIFTPPDDKICRIKACIHGCLVKHGEKEPLDMDVIKMLSQPFIGSEASQPTTSGTLMSDKAIVILEDQNF